MKFKNLFQSLTLGALLLGSSGSFAAQWCIGTVDDFYIDGGVNSNGSIYVSGSWGSGFTRICQLNSTLNGVPSSLCKSWLSIIESATITSKTIGVYYTGDASCTNLGTYDSTPKVTAVRMIR